MINYYLISINLLTFIIFVIDKYKAINNKWRIKEFYLITLCLGGGSLGAIFAMYLFHHKTKKLIFKYLIPIIFLFQIIIIFYLK